MLLVFLPPATCVGRSNPDGKFCLARVYWGVPFLSYLMPQRGSVLYLPGACLQVGANDHLVEPGNHWIPDGAGGRERSTCMPGLCRGLWRESPTVANLSYQWEVAKPHWQEVHKWRRGSGTAPSTPSLPQPVPSSHPQHPEDTPDSSAPGNLTPPAPAPQALLLGRKHMAGCRLSGQQREPRVPASPQVSLIITTLIKSTSEMSLWSTPPRATGSAPGQALVTVAPSSPQTQPLNSFLRIREEQGGPGTAHRIVSLVGVPQAEGSPPPLGQSSSS